MCFQGADDDSFLKHCILTDQREPLTFKSTIVHSTFYRPPSLPLRNTNSFTTSNITYSSSAQGQDGSPTPRLCILLPTQQPKPDTVAVPAGSIYTSPTLYLHNTHNAIDRSPVRSDRSGATRPCICREAAPFHLTTARSTHLPSSYDDNRGGCCCCCSATFFEHRQSTRIPSLCGCGHISRLANCNGESK